MLWCFYLTVQLILLFLIKTQKKRVNSISHFITHNFVRTIICFWSSSKNPSGWGAMQKPQLLLGMIAIFTYVGVEVTIQSNLGELLKVVADKVNQLNP